MYWLIHKNFSMILFISYSRKFIPSGAIQYILHPSFGPASPIYPSLTVKTRPALLDKVPLLSALLATFGTTKRCPRLLVALWHCKACGLSVTSFPYFLFNNHCLFLPCIIFHIFSFTIMIYRRKAC